MTTWNTDKNLFEFQQLLINSTPIENKNVSRLSDSKTFYSTCGLNQGTLQALPTTTTTTPIYFNESIDDALTFPDFYSTYLRYSLKYFVGLSSTDNINCDLCIMYYDADKNYISKSVTKTVTSNDENINIEIIVDNFSYPINTKYIFLGSTNGRTSDLTFYFNYANIIVKTSQEEIGENPKSNDNNLFIFISGTGGGIGPNPIPDDLTINKLNLKFTETPDGVEHKPRLNFEGETSAIIGSLEIWDNKITLTGGDVDVSNNKLINLKACVLDTDGANKKYVDDTVVALNADLTQLESDVNTLENDVNNLQTQQTTNTNNILTNTNNITTVTNQTSTNTTAIGVLNNSLAGKLSTVGGSMSGNILMGGNNINGLTAINLQGGGGLYADSANTTFLKPFSTTTLGQIFNFTNHNGTITTMFIRTVERVMELLGPIRMNGNFIYNIADGVGSKDCVNKSQLDTKLSISGGVMGGDIDMSSQSIIRAENISFPSNTGEKLNYLVNPDGIRSRYTTEVQARTLAFRTEQSFAFYKNGDFNPARLNPGGGQIFLTMEATDGTNVNDKVKVWKTLDNSGNDLIMSTSLSGDSNQIIFRSSPGTNTNRILTIGNGNFVFLSGEAFLAISTTSLYTNRLLNMNSNKITNVSNATSGFDAVNLNMLNSAVSKMYNPINMPITPNPRNYTNETTLLTVTTNDYTLFTATQRLSYEFIIPTLDFSAEPPNISYKLNIFEGSDSVAYVLMKTYPLLQKKVGRDGIPSNCINNVGIYNPTRNLSPTKIRFTITIVVATGGTASLITNNWANYQDGYLITEKIVV